MRPHFDAVRAQASLWTAFQYLVWHKDYKLVGEMHTLRDEMRRNSEGGREACDLASFGLVSQPLGQHTLGLVNAFPDEWAHHFKPELDAKVFPHLMCMGAKASAPHFTSLLSQICPSDDTRFELLVGPIKKPSRIAVKVHEYSDEHDGDLSDWPFISKVGDVLRVTIKCQDGDALFVALQRVITTFDLRDGNGRFKNMLATTKHMPPRCLINVVVRADGCAPIMAEIQVYLAAIKQIADDQHHYY